MPINAITGLPGAGKSYFAVQRMVELLGEGKKVITNLPVKRDEVWNDVEGSDNLHIVDLDGVEVSHSRDREKVRDDEGRPENVLSLDRVLCWDDGAAVYFLDEIGTFCDRIKRDRDLWGRWMMLLREHRHAGHEIYFMAQDAKQLHNDIRNGLVEYWIEIDRIEDLGVPYWVMGVYKSHIRMGREAISVKQGGYKKSVFALYDSYALGQMSGSDQGSGSSVIRFRWRRAVVGLCILVIVGGVVVLTQVGGSAFGFLTNPMGGAVVKGGSVERSGPGGEMEVVAEVAVEAERVFAADVARVDRVLAVAAGCKGRFGDYLILNEGLLLENGSRVKMVGNSLVFGIGSLVCGGLGGE